MGSEHMMPLNPLVNDHVPYEKLLFRRYTHFQNTKATGFASSAQAMNSGGQAILSAIGCGPGKAVLVPGIVCRQICDVYWFVMAWGSVGASMQAQY